VRLLDGTCAFDTRRDTTKALHDEDLRILLGMARERFSGAQSLLRQQAILALARTKNLDAVEELTTLATCPVEHLAARSTAAQALRALSPSVANLVLETMPPTPAQTDRKRKRRAPARDGSP
jgi:HEAT repeat protein